MISSIVPVIHNAGGGGESAYERGRDARRKFWIKPLKETYLGVAQAFFVPWKRPRYTLNETFTAKYDGVLPRTP